MSAARCLCFFTHCLGLSEGRQNKNHNCRKQTNMITCVTALCNSMKIWTMPCKATQDRRIMVERSDKHGALEKGMASHYSILALRTPWTIWEGKKIGHWKMNPQIRVGEEWGNKSKRNEEAEPKWKWCLVGHQSGGESKVWCNKKQYCIRTWNVRSMNQYKLKVVKQEMTRGTIDILGISELKWTEMCTFNSGKHYIY